MTTMMNSVNIDLTIPSTVSQSNNKNNLLLENTSNLCPKHEQEHRWKNRDDGEDGGTSKKLHRNSINKSKPCNFSKVQRVFGKSSLQKKLDRHGIKIKVGFASKRKIAPTNSERENETKFSITELKFFNVSHLRIIHDAMRNKIDALSKEMAELNEENERHSSDKEGLKMTVINFEELALRVMKPWVNSMPHSDEMTRVMLLN